MEYNVNPGDIVYFPCDSESYEYRTGVVLEFRDNPSDIPQIGSVASWLKKPRKIADILYKGKVFCCWAHNLRTPENATTRPTFLQGVRL